MLSYRHAFHAGNHADMLKHLVLVYCLDYMTRKTAPLRYLDTHSGAGLYQLNSAQARKTGEAAAGILRLRSLKPVASLLQRYLALVELASGKAGSLYPGSPWLAAQCLREDDRLVLTELHSTDYPLLQQSLAGDRRIKTAAQDGFERLLSELPAPERRALVLIDPSYEVKSDYEQVGRVVAKALKKMPTAVILVWLPVVERNRSHMLERSLGALAEKARAFELGVSPDQPGRGMTASVMMALNAPWGLAEAMNDALPELLQALELSETGHFRVRTYGV